MGPHTTRTRPVTVRVFAYAPTIFTHCQHCEIVFGTVGVGERIQRREAASALPEDLLVEYQQVSDWVHSLLERQGDRVLVKVVDPASLQGFWRSLRHGVRRYPAVLIDEREKVVGTDFAAADRLIDRCLAEREGSTARGREGAA